MSESFQLQEWEDSRGRGAIQPVPSPRQKKPVHLAIVCAFIIISGANLLYTHTSNTNLKSILAKYKKVLQAQINITDYNVHKVKMEIMLKLLTQKYFQNLERKMYYMESISELEEFHLPERQRILKEFETENTLNANSPLYKDLKAKLESELDRVYLGLESESQDWNATIIKAFQQVQNVYSEEYKRGVLEYKGNDLISPEVSIEFHEKMAHIAISKCVRNKLVPTSTGVVLELKLLLDQAYHKKIGDHAVIGIHFGDNTIRAAVYFQGKIQMIPHLDRSGKVYNFTACYVGVSKYDGYVGQCAQSILESSLQLSPVLYDIWRVVDLWFNRFLQHENKNWTFYSEEGGDDGPIVSGVGFRYPVKFIVSKLFSKVRQNAEAFLGQPVKRCAVTYPHFFSGNDTQTLLSNAAEMAGFTQVALLVDHTAAALALQHVRGAWNSTKTVLYIDFADRKWKHFITEGYQTSFISLIWNYEDSGFYLKESLMNYSIQQFSVKENVPQNTIYSESIDGKIRMQRLLESCRSAVKRLSKTETTTIVVPEFAFGKSLAVNITRKEFEALNNIHFDEISKILTVHLNATEINKDNVEVILTGEDSFIPKLRQVLEYYFPGKNLDIAGVQSEDVVAYGAAVKGAMLAAESIKADKSN